MSDWYHASRAYRPIAEWVTANSGWVPVGEAIPGGNDINGETIFVGRSHHEGDVIPGKIVPSHGCCYVAWGGNEHSKREYQALVTPSGCELVWVRAYGSNIPTGAIQGGMTADGEPLYIGRHEHEGSFVVGKVQPSHGSCYIAFGGGEHAYSEYDILCVKNIPFH